MKGFSVSLLILACCCSFAQITATDDEHLIIPTPSGRLEIHAVADDVLSLDFRPFLAGTTQLLRDKPSDIMDLNGLRKAQAVGGSVGDTVQTERFVATADASGLVHVLAQDSSVSLSIECDSQGILISGSTGPLYGMRGIELGGRNPGDGLMRNTGAAVSGSAQGDGGAPLAYTASWGLFVDSVDGTFGNSAKGLSFSNGSRKETEAYLILGRPERTIEVATELTGRPPMPPKWALGFMNSQWGTTQKEVDDIIDTYRAKQIPIDAFILDFDFKAWGEDNFGEFRWNSTSGAGSVSPDKFPDGASGKFGKEMMSKGIHLAGIMKPRILTQNKALNPTMAAAEVTAHGWWMPGKKPYQDYFSGRLANDLNFADLNLRRWYWKHAKGLFDTGISGWWNDEADEGFDSLGFFHMQQSLYDGQRSVADRRVWSINRNFYLGAQRFGFGTWSGDINTGFKSMQDQRARMLTMLDIGQSHWSMDSGGFGGHPSPENYARWLEFASTVPIMRVHNTYGEHRQPWVYGPIAEAAAKKAIEFRYSLFPYLYSLEHDGSRTGVGIDRPLFWEFPRDPMCANKIDSWMMGDALLVSPVVEKGQTEKRIYLPGGKWFGYFDGKEYEGGQTITTQTDSTNWSDIPVFVRSGSIVATQPVLQFTWQRPVEEITLDVWPDARHRGRFEVYDDDGETYRYEHGAFFSQPVSAGAGSVTFGAAEGSYRTPIRNYRIRVHGPFSSAQWNRSPIAATQGSGYLEVIVPSGKEGELSFR